MCVVLRALSFLNQRRCSETSGDVGTLSRSVGRWVGGTSGGVGTLSGSVGRAVSERCREVSGGGWWSCERND